MSGRPSMISVVVCTADRKAKLKSQLASLAQVTVPMAFSAELIVVNNKPAVDINPLVSEVSKGLPMPVEVVSEAAPGISGARNIGAKLCRGEIIAFTDDDCVVDDDWLVRIWECFASDSRLMGLGGRVELFDPADQPITVRRGDSPAHLSSTDQIFGFLHGCNMAVRRDLFDRIGGFDPNFGSGSSVSAGEDTEFLFRAYQAGARIRYEPRALVLHHHGRTTRSSARRTLIRYHLANGAILAKHAGRGDEKARSLLRGIALAPLASPFRWPFSASEILRAWYRLSVWGFGALRYRMFVETRIGG